MQSNLDHHLGAPGFFVEPPGLMKTQKGKSKVHTSVGKKGIQDIQKRLKTIN